MGTVVKSTENDVSSDISNKKQNNRQNRDKGGDTKDEWEPFEPMRKRVDAREDAEETDKHGRQGHTAACDTADKKSRRLRRAGPQPRNKQSGDKLAR